MNIRIASPTIYDSIVDGPGLRMVLWTQGCPHNCKGCHNPKTHSNNGGYEIDIKEVTKQMSNMRLQKGITFSGGEPFLQQEALKEIAIEAKNNNLDIWCYTGFTFEELLDKSNPSYFKNLNLLKYIDVLVDGRFVEEKKKFGLKFRGSTNQRIIDVQKSLKYKNIFLNENYYEKNLYEAK